MATSLRAARAEILDRVADPPPGVTFIEEVMRALEKAVGSDGYCLFGVDPISGLRSVMFSRDGLAVPTERLVHNETVERDANRYQDLLDQDRHVGTLTAGPVAEPRSSRLHDMLRPQGYGAELRLVLTTGNRYWGALSLFREGARYPFTEAESDLVQSLSGELSLALRRYQVGRPALVRRVRPPGVVIFRTEGAALTISEEAHAWLRDLAQCSEHGATEEDLLRVTHEVAAAASQDSGPAMCRSRMPDGSWLVVSGTRIRADGMDVAVVLQSGSIDAVLPAFSVWCGLTRQESGILSLVAAGLPAKLMARKLAVSVLTVNDHLKAIYRKAGIHGREELLALLY